MHCGYVVKVEQIRKHENADRLQIASFFGNDTVVSLDTKMGDVGIYFPSDLQLSKEYCERNNLVRKKDENGKEIGGYLDPEKRNIKAIKLRGEKSDGMFMPLTSLDYCYWYEGDGDGTNASEYLHIGDTITVVNGHEICCKYIPKIQVAKGSWVAGNKTRKHKVPYSPLFMEHADTEQLQYNLGAFNYGDEIEITLKMHGTSQRTALLPILKGYKKTFLEKLLKKDGTPVYEFGEVTGTRRVVLDDFDKEGFYGSNQFRYHHHTHLLNKLMKGETIYYEVVGFTDTGVPIMATGNNEKLGKEFVAQYGKETVFSYGCSPIGYKEDAESDNEKLVELPQSDVYVYRMTMTNEDGFVVEYPPSFMRYRCEQMGLKGVLLLDKFTIPEADKCIVDDELVTAGEYVMAKAVQLCGGPDPVGKTHIREGVVCRILNRPRFCAYKHKNFEFKVLEGILKDSALAPDVEEIQEILEVSNDT